MFKSKSSRAARMLAKQAAESAAAAAAAPPKPKQDYLDDCHRTYSCIHCRAHLANHDELISKLFQGNHGRAYLFNKVVNVGCKQAITRELLTGLHAVCDIYCKTCETTLGWKYEQAFVPSQKYKEGKFIIELVHMLKENHSDLSSYNYKQQMIKHQDHQHLQLGEGDEKGDHTRARTMGLAAEPSRQRRSLVSNCRLLDDYARLRATVRSTPSVNLHPPTSATNEGDHDHDHDDDPRQVAIEVPAEARGNNHDSTNHNHHHESPMVTRDEDGRRPAGARRASERLPLGEINLNHCSSQQQLSQGADSSMRVELVAKGGHGDHEQATRGLEMIERSLDERLCLSEAAGLQKGTHHQLLISSSAFGDLSVGRVDTHGSVEALGSPGGSSGGSSVAGSSSSCVVVEVAASQSAHE